MLQNDLFAAGTGTGPCQSSRPRAVALERSALAFSRELALVIQGSAAATRTKERDGGPIGAALLARNTPGAALTTCGTGLLVPALA